MARPVCGGGLVAAIVLLGATSGSTHERHAHSPSPSPTAPGSTDAGAPAPPSAAPAPTAAPTPVPPIKVEVRDALFQHLHNKVVHFPLAIGGAAALLLILSARWPQYWPAARLLLFLAAAAAIGAYFSGRVQEEELEDGPLREYLSRHRLLGTLSGITLWAGVGLSFIPQARRLLWIYALLLMGLLSATGFLGGILSHTAI